ncbi:DUF6317 family protein [Streptomyces sp. 8L]|uniref:DUF6317 family protein n=1 Tax=Streptomyces sp. 8L TaxID=2877242 RepID=UPI001CD5BBF2|nr:DUF6317 family protein [Streptomyces sp. 8L]MCA1221141.1 DUF6317 family protein [Streptomyces sp. 8L]
MGHPDYQVVLGDLSAMASRFTKEAVAYHALHQEVKPTVAASGDPGLDSMIEAMAELIAGLHDKLGDRIADHGDTLKYAHDSYQRHDVDVHGVFEDLT